MEGSKVALEDGVMMVYREKKVKVVGRNQVGPTVNWASRFS